MCVCVLQALQYLRKLCNHPGLVLTPQHPEYKRITEQLAIQNTSLRDIQHAPKLSALKQVHKNNPEVRSVREWGPTRITRTKRNSLYSALASPKRSLARMFG